MKFIDIFIPINMVTIDAEKQKTIRSYWGFLTFAIFGGVAIMVFPMQSCRVITPPSSGACAFATSPREDTLQQEV